MGILRNNLLRKHSLCLVLLMPLCACLDFDDEREDNEIYKLYSTRQGSFDLKISELFPEEWEFVCVMPPGSSPSILLKHLLPDSSDKNLNVADPEDFPDHLWKFILVDKSRENIRLLQLDKRDFNFRGEVFCASAKGMKLYFTEEKDSSYGRERSNFLVEVR